MRLLFSCEDFEDSEDFEDFEEEWNWKKRRYHNEQTTIKWSLKKIQVKSKRGAN